MDNQIPSAVFDTNIFLQATISKFGPSASALDLFEQGKVTLYVSDELVDEISDVLNRPSVRRKNAHYTDADIEALLTRIEARSIKINNLPGHFSYERDPDDEHVINLAIEAGVDYLVSRDKDLLDLMDKDTKDGRLFREQFSDIVILDPLIFIRLFSTTTNGQ